MLSHRSIKIWILSADRANKGNEQKIAPTSEILKYGDNQVLIVFKGKWELSDSELDSYTL